LAWLGTAVSRREVMTCTVEMRRSPDITEEEVRRRLAACYDLLLDLAERHKDDAPDDAREPDPDDPTDQTKADYQETLHTGVGSDARQVVP